MVQCRKLACPSAWEYITPPQNAAMLSSKTQPSDTGAAYAQNIAAPSVSTSFPRNTHCRK